MALKTLKVKDVSMGRSGEALNGLHHAVNIFIDGLFSGWAEGKITHHWLIYRDQEEQEEEMPMEFRHFKDILTQCFKCEIHMKSSRPPADIFGDRPQREQRWPIHVFVYGDDRWCIRQCKLIDNEVDIDVDVVFREEEKISKCSMGAAKGEQGGAVGGAGNANDWSEKQKSLQSAQLNRLAASNIHNRNNSNSNNTVCSNWSLSHFGRLPVHGGSRRFTTPTIL